VIEVITPAGRLVARGVSKVSAALMGLIRAMRTDEIAIVMTEILARFQDAPGPRADMERRNGGSGATPLRPPVIKALDQVGGFGYETTRRLALEVINLFPAATAEAMLEAGRDEGLARLRQRYSRLSSDLSFIDRNQLVVY
jgi:glutamate 5-kinase